MLPSNQIDTWTKATDEQKELSLDLLAGLPSRTSNDPALDAQAMMISLEGVTRYALNIAVQDVLRRKLGHTFFPTGPELRGLCDQAMQPVWSAQRRAMNQLESARLEQGYQAVRAERTPESIARVKAKTEAFHASLASNDRKGEEAERARIRAEYGMTPEAMAKIKDAPVRDFRKAVQ